MNLQTLKISEIKVEDRAREDMGDIEALAESIEQKGLLQPITVDQYKRLLAGGRRLEALKLLKWDTAEFLVRETTGKIDRKEVELFENIHRSDLKWPERAKLEREIYELMKDKGDWSQRKQAEATGYSQSGINRRIQLAEALELLPELAEHETEDAAWKEYKRLEEGAVTKELTEKVSKDPKLSQATKYAKDHFKIGNALEMMPKVGKEKADFAEVDPPYAVALKELKSRNKDKHNAEAYTEISDEEYPAFLEKAAAEVYRILKPNSYCVWWHADEWDRVVLDTLRKVGFQVNPIPAIWYKGPVGQASQPDVALASCYEPFFVCRKGKPKLKKAGRGNVFDFKPIPGPKKTHTTEKPIDLLEEILGTFCFPGSTVLCPFLGSGVTLRAAYKLGHTGFGYDLNEQHKEAFLQKVMEEIEAKEAA